MRGNFPLFPGKKEVVVEATDYLTYAIVDITSLVAGAVHRTMKLYSKSSLDLSGGGVRVTPLCLISLSGVGIGENPKVTSGRENVCDIESLSHLTCRPEFGRQWGSPL